MIHGEVELHNVAELRAVDGCEGLLMQRVPEAVRLALNAGAQHQAMRPANVEVRFVCEDGPARVVLSGPDGGVAVVFHGMFQAETCAIGLEPRAIELAVPEPLQMLGPRQVADMPFPPTVTRLMLGGGPMFFHGVEGKGLRPPRPGELPTVRYLAYGTSITHGAAATGPHLRYAAQTAWRLGADLVNLGLAGSCHCEPELADYIAGREDWDFATLALSVNMIGAGFSLEEFYDRVSYMVNTVAGADTRRPVACITIYPHRRDFGDVYRAAADKGTPEQYRQQLRRAVEQCPHPNVHLLEGSEILSEVRGLTPDLVHPADNGMILMGENLARRLQPILRRCVGARRVGEG